MLVATAYNVVDFNGPPRVISEVRKSCGAGGRSLLDLRPKLTGELLVKNPGDKKWWPRRAVVRYGQLQVSGCHAEGAPAALRLPLRHLSLRAGALPNSLCLCRDQAVVLTLQTANEQAFDIWVKTIAIELIRQTPLEAVKYLDIFTLANCWKQKTPPSSPTSFKDCNENYLELPQHPCKVLISSPPPTPKFPHQTEAEEDGSRSSNNSEQKTVETLLKRCQNAESYVPVKEKLILFESLCKLGRKVRSTEDVSCKSVSPTKRARSMHDLSNFQCHSAVKEICRYFEVKNEAVCSSSVNKYGTIARFNRSDSQLSQKNFRRIQI